jgi:threonine synthase
MDILVSSNLERLLYHLSGDAGYVAGLMDELATTGSYTVSDELLSKIQELFGCGFATDAQCAEAIRYTFERTGVLIDPHTAVGKYVMDDMRPSGRARVLLSTASPFKFPADCLAALGARTEGLDGFSSMDELARTAEASAPEALSRLRTMPRLHDDVCDIDAMPGFVEDFAGEVFA